MVKQLFSLFFRHLVEQQQQQQQQQPSANSWNAGLPARLRFARSCPCRPTIAVGWFQASFSNKFLPGRLQLGNLFRAKGEVHDKGQVVEFARLGSFEHVCRQEVVTGEFLVRHCRGI